MILRSTKMKAKEMIGQRFGRLLVEERAENKDGNRYTMWKCRWDCGNEIIVNGSTLHRGDINSCGCLRKGALFHKTHGCSKERLYGVWIGMKDRCYQPKATGYKNYGGRGIKICDEWLDYENFRKWAYENGYDENAPKGQCTIDRKDNDGDYSPSNCHFISKSEQNKNRRKGNKYTVRKKSVKMWKTY